MRTAISLCTLLVLASGPLPAQSHKPRVDAQGDPLPDAAIARLGTLRFVHLGGLKSVAVSPDGKMAASGVSKGESYYTGHAVYTESGAVDHTRGEWLTRTTIRLWDTATGRCLREIATPDAPVHALQFDATGRFLIAGCNRYMCCWDATTGDIAWQTKVATEFFYHGVEAETLHLHKDRLVSVQQGQITCTTGASSYHYRTQHVVRFWDPKTGNAMATPRALESSLKSQDLIERLFHDVAISRDGRFAAVYVSDATPVPTRDKYPHDRFKFKNGRLQIIELASGKVVQTTQIAEDSLQHLTLSDNGAAVAFVAANKLYLVHTATNETEMLVHDLPARIFTLKFVHARHLAAQCDDWIRVWDIRSGERVNPHHVRDHDFADSSNGAVCALADGNCVRLIDTASGKSLQDLPGHRLTPTIRYALKPTWHDAPRRDGRRGASFHVAPFTLLSRDAELLHRWDTRTRTCQESISIPRDPDRWPWRWYRWYKTDVDQDIAIEMGLYAAKLGDTLQLRDLKTDRYRRELPDLGGPPSNAMFSANGIRLAVRGHGSRFSARGDGPFHLIDVPTGQSLGVVQARWAHYLGYNSPDRMSPVGSYFATNHNHTTIDLHDTRTAKIARRLAPVFGDGSAKEGKQGSILGYQFSADERFVVGEVHQLNIDDGEKVSLTLWRTDTGEIIQDMVINPRAYIFWRRMLNEPLTDSLAVSPDQRFIALTRPGSKSIEIWEVASGTKRGELFGHAGIVADLAFSPDGKQLASSSEDTTILLWDLDRPFRRGIYPAHLSDADLTRHWHDLLESDGWHADDVIWGLVHAAKVSVPFLRKQLTPVARADAAQVKRLLSALDSIDFRARARAESDLERLGEQVLTELQEALRQNNSLERRRRLDVLLQRAQLAAKPFGTAERTRQARAMEVLERIGSPDAIAVLRDLASGAPGARLTLAAQEVVRRIP